MEILNNFGFEPVLFAAQIVNFLILAFVFKKYLYKPILKVIRDREEKIAQGLKDADSARITLEKADARRNQIIKAATLDAEKIIDETRAAATELRDKLTEQSKKDAEKIIEEARIAAQAEFEKARKEAQDMSIDLSKKLLDKVISGLFTRQEREKILQRNIKMLEDYE